MIVYGHYKKTSGEIFYIGQGSLARSRCEHNRNAFWQRIVKRHGFYVQIFASGLTREEAVQLETNLIAFYGKRPLGCLCNLSDGGQGASGYKWSDEARKRKSEATFASGNKFWLHRKYPEKKKRTPKPKRKQKPRKRVNPIVKMERTKRSLARLFSLKSISKFNVLDLP